MRKTIIPFSRLIIAQYLIYKAAKLYMQVVFCGISAILPKVSGGSDSDGGWDEEEDKERREQKKGRRKCEQGGERENQIKAEREKKKKSLDTFKNHASDISQGESEDKYFFFLPFCRLVGSAAPLIVPVWQYHFVLNLSFSLSLLVNVEK